MRATRYSIAVLTTILAIALTAAFPELLAPMRLFFLWCAILITAIVAGVRPALLSIGLSVLAAAFVVFEPIGSFAVHNGTDMLRMALFASFATAITFGVGRASALSERLKTSEQRYRTLIEATPVAQAVWTATPEGRIRWSEQWTAITGLSREELASGDGMRVVHAEDAARTWARWRDALANATPYQDEIRVRVANGRYRWFAIRAVPIVSEAPAETPLHPPAGGRHAVAEWVGIVADIHDRKRHEESASFINRASEVLASSLDPAVTMRTLARLAVPTLGDWCTIHLATGGGDYERFLVEHSDPAKLRVIEQLDPRVRAAPEVDPIAQVLQSGKSQLIEDMAAATIDAVAESNEQLAVIRQLGFRSWIVAPMTTGGRVIGTLTVVHGDSGRRHSEEDVPLIEELARRSAIALDNARLYEAAESANRAKDEFLATLSHELRTPLTAIAGWAHMLQVGTTDKATTALAVDTIVRSAKAQGELIDDLLDLSRIVAGTLHLHVLTVDLVKIAEEVLVSARPAAEAKALRLELTSGTHTRVLVRGDERRLRQVVWNLVSNAVKFTGSGGRVSVTATAHGSMGRVEVSDTGRGIEPEFLPYVWDRFRQADSSSSRQHGGLGLGLSVVRHLVDLHGGTVHAASSGSGQGATFWFELPLARFDEAALAAVLAATSEEKLLRARRILVVDDDDDARLVITAMLRQFGAEVVATSSAAHAMAALETFAFDAVVSDIAMPEEDGYSLLRRIHASLQIPVIAVTAMALGPEDRRRALGAGFADFVRKPVEPKQLALAVAAAMR
ncbi:MAG TPA: ATP-binding protein [Thermoanaerobaculia bacterium]|nr:ATP-binding protein [Thermoanaerobaculia bacterium]